MRKNLYSTKITALLDDAEAKGYTVHEEDKRVFITKGKTLRSYGVVVYVDGATGSFVTANRSDVDLSIALSIRTIKAVRKALDI